MRTPAGATQSIPQSSVQGVVKPVEVAAGSDNTFWVVLAIPTYNTVEKILCTLIHCHKPEDPDEEVPAAAGTNSSQTATDNTVTRKQLGRPQPGDGAQNAPSLACNLLIHTQPQLTAAMHLSGKSLDAEPHLSETSAGDSWRHNQPESFEMITIQETSMVSPHALPKHTPLTDSLSLVTFREPLSSTAFVMSALFTPPTSGWPSSHNIEVLSVDTLSPEEMTMIQELRRHKAAFSLISMAPRSLGGSEYHSQSSAYPHPLTSPPQLRGSANQPRSHIHAQPSQSSVGLDLFPLSSSLARDDIKMTSTASPADQEDLRQAILWWRGTSWTQVRTIIINCTQVTNHAGSSLKLDLLAVEEGTSLRAEPSGPKSTASTSQAGPSMFSNVPSQRHPHSSVASITDSIEAEERVKDDRRRAKAERKKP
ncbi:hypothetical protein BDN67DRAFT_1016481 [Paxillus ammoniavirescens]|nr:hypothetical protein BDN67DRAFT_1016481 [Paxillus ammoniavirescens]